MMQVTASQNLGQELDDDFGILSRLLDQAPLPSYILDLRGVVLYANGPGDELLGRGRTGCLGLNLVQAVYPADRDEAQWLTEALLEGRRPSYRAEHRFVDANNRRLWVSISVSLLNDSSGQPKYLWLQAADIEEQKNAALGLAAAERRWSFALESAGQGVWESDLERGTVFYSPSWTCRLVSRCNSTSRPKTGESDAMTENQMRDHPIDAEIAAVRTEIPRWIDETIELVELAVNRERVGNRLNPDTAERSRKLIVEVAQWQQKLTDWQSLDIGPRLHAELRILKATLDAAMDEANAAARQLLLQ
ncbi:PAS domain-containing protein [Devosia salina]|uniref:PAS domain S-box protein n=1 Tax=Devosia salina TaxID=2860336 RepID=A0ABX8W917_9HYPH|nr:PAS domain S-box protein [Devosia salina]QYO75191.1 PAS domain S-box protein [Devosia salina]